MTTITTGNGNTIAIDGEDLYLNGSKVTFCKDCFYALRAEGITEARYYCCFGGKGLTREGGFCHRGSL